MTFYAVIRGHYPGIYSNYHDYVRETKGYPNNYAKKFREEWEAKIFFGYNREDKYRIVPSEDLCYVIIRGRKTGLFSDLNECKRATSGFRNSYYRKFTTRWAAEIFFHDNREDTYRESESLEELTTSLDED